MIGVCYARDKSNKIQLRKWQKPQDIVFFHRGLTCGGDMSVVGPRPLLVKYLERYSGEQHHRHDVKPGLSGYAQINGRNTVSWDEKFKMDGRGVAPGDTKTIFTATFKTQGDIFDFGEQISEVTVYVIYEDIYQIQWIKQLNLGKEVERYLEIIKNKNCSTKEFSNTYEPYRKSV